MSEIAARYSQIADSYAALWSPVIRPMAAPAIAALPSAARIVLDVGCGTGALRDDLRRATGGAALPGVDASEGMLRLAGGPVACADARHLPVASRAVDAAIAVFMLHHVPDPPAAVAEIARVLTPGGIMATVTWGADTAWEAGTLWDALLDDAGAASAAEPADSRSRFDDDAKAAAIIAAAGLQAERIWVARPEYRGTTDGLCSLYSQYGRFNDRWRSVAEPDRSQVLAAFRAQIDRDPDLLVWRPQVVYAVARRD